MSKISNKSSSIDKALLILNLLAEPPYEKSALEISESLNIHRSTVHRILNILISNEAIQQSPSTKKYSIGPASYHVGVTYLRSQTNIEQIKILLDSLAKEINQSIGYAILVEDKILSIFEIASQDIVQIGFKVGTYYPLHCGAYGKCIMAYYEPYEELEKLIYSIELEKKGPNTLTDPEAILEEFSSIRKQGYAISDEENMKGIVAIGVPIRDIENRVIACVAVKYIKGNVSDEEKTYYINKLIEYSTKIQGIMV